MNAFVWPANGKLSLSTDYFSRTLDFPGLGHLGADISSVLDQCRPALGRLRQGYKELSRRSDRMDYSGSSTQLAYLLAYTPHHAAQLQRALTRSGGIPSMRPERAPTSVVCLAAGPGSELLGCSFALRGAALPGGPIRMKACLVDKRADSWCYGRAIVNYHLQHADHREVGAWAEVAHDAWNVATERMPDSVARKIAGADLITCMNVLTEIAASGPDACGFFLWNMQQVLGRMKEGATLLVSDYAGYPSSLELLSDIESGARGLGLYVTAIEERNVDSPFARVRDRRLETEFFSAKESPRKKLHTASLLIRKL